MRRFAESSAAVRAVGRMPGALLAVLLAACVGGRACPTGPDPEPRRVVIDNRSGAALRLCRAVRDGWGPEVALGSAPTIPLELVPGRHALALGDGAPSVPLPLPVAELGFRPERVTTVTVWPAPAQQAGWCWIPAGIHLRGDDLGIGQEDERPLATPLLPGFWLAERETTNAQFVAFLNSLGASHIGADWLDLAGPKCRIRWDAGQEAFTTDAPDRPVVTVAWAGAVAYCAWCTHETGVPHRLPTEAEWEKAARGPGSRVYAYGDTYRVAAANQESGVLLATGSFPPNGFGLRDMTGNAFEWTGDRFVRSAYGGSVADDDDRAGVERRALRGGSFVLDGIFVRNSMRMGLRPTVRADDVGFRVVRENVDPTFGP